MMGCDSKAWLKEQLPLLSWEESWLPFPVSCVLSALKTSPCAEELSLLQEPMEVAFLEAQPPAQPSLQRMAASAIWRATSLGDPKLQPPAKLLQTF